MIGPSDLYRIPLCTSPSQPEELLRYARYEHGAASLEWAAPTAPRTALRVPAIREWLATHLRLPRAAAMRAPTRPLHAGLAAVHFDGEGTREIAARHPHTNVDHPCDLLATSAVILTVQSHQPDADEACTCDH